VIGAGSTAIFHCAYTPRGLTQPVIGQVELRIVRDTTRETVAAFGMIAARRKFSRIHGLGNRVLNAIRVELAEVRAP
jgi:hypothetical protein